MTLVEFERIAAIASPFLVLLLGQLTKTLFQARPRVVRYLVHVSTHIFPLEGGGHSQVRTHAVTYENLGRRTAHNLRISHGFLPSSINLDPRVAYTREPFSDGSPGGDIVIPMLAPRERVVVSYLYPPGISAGDVAGPAKCEEALVKDVQAIPTPRPNKIIMTVLWTFVAIGAWFSVYSMLTWAYRFIVAG